MAVCEERNMLFVQNQGHRQLINEPIILSSNLCSRMKELAPDFYEGPLGTGFPQKKDNLLTFMQLMDECMANIRDLFCNSVCYYFCIDIRKPLQLYDSLAPKAAPYFIFPQ